MNNNKIGVDMFLAAVFGCGCFAIIAFIALGEMELVLSMLLFQMFIVHLVDHNKWRHK